MQILVALASLMFLPQTDLPFDPIQDGKPLSAWVRSIDARRPEMDRAFGAIKKLGPKASAAVPDLVRILNQPFAPIQVGTDSHTSVFARITEIDVRSEIVDTLAAIGPAAAASTPAIFRWAIAQKVVIDNIRNKEDYELFIELVMVDVMERMRAAGAVAMFGAAAAVDLSVMITSSDEDKRKLAVAVLNERALSVAAELLKDPRCSEQKLGAALMTDMWPVVARGHLLEFRQSIQCEPTEVRKH